ncbi:hypothetical protein Tco_1137137 [Tanacetum coccineum]
MLREQAANLSSHTPEPLRRFNCICYDDDDDEESTIPLNEIISQIPQSIAITPVLPTMEPEDSLIIRDENLSTIPKKESDKVIKFSVKDLVQIPRGNFVIFSNHLFDPNDDFTSSDDESFPEDIESKESYVSNLDEQALLVTHLFELNEDECFDPEGDEIEACLTSNSIPPGIDGTDFDLKGEILLLEKLLNDDISFPLPLKELHFEGLKVIKYCIPPDFEDDYYNSEGDTIFLKSLLINDTIPNLPPEVFLDHGQRSLKDEYDNNDLKGMVKVFDPSIHEKIISPTYVMLPFEDRHYISLTFVIKIFLPFLTYLVNSLLLLSSGSEDTIFDPGIFAYSLYSLKPVAYESPMEICSSTFFVPNFTMIWGESS